MQTGTILQYDDTPHEHARLLSLDGGLKVLEGSTEMLCVCRNVRVLESQKAVDSYEDIKAVVAHGFQQELRQYVAVGIHL
jgi:hypothetical protein